MSTTRYVETDALAALRDELTRAAARRAGPRRSARRIAIAAAIVVGLLAATAAAAELTGFTTGVPVIDELVGIESKAPSPGEADRRPGPGDATEPLAVRIGDGTYQTVAYLARDGSICIVSAERHRGGVRGSTGGCPPIEDVNRRVERRGAVWYGGTRGLDQRTYKLLVGGEVESVGALGAGDWRVQMTRPWTPQAPRARPLRLVVVSDEKDLDESDLLETGFPRLELTDADGRTRVAQAP